MTPPADQTQTDPGDSEPGPHLPAEIGPPSSPSELDTLHTQSGGIPERREETALPRGAPLGRYLVLERLGMGGMGIVYAAYDPELDRKVAVKLVRPSSLRASGRAHEVRQRLLREAQAMARLSHPNVVAVHDVGMVDEQVFVAMEYIEGRSLRAWVGDANAPPWRERLDVMRQAGRGLAAAHAKGLVHRDFKPDNVMVDHEGRVVVMDFGLARDDRRALPSSTDEPDLAPSDEDEVPADAPRASASTDPVPGSTPLHTDAARLVGTPAYMAPEQFAGATANTRTDQFGYCVTLYELLYGERPFGGDALHSLVSAMVMGSLRPEPRGTQVPRWLRRVVLRGLSHDPDERWPSMDALLDALARDPARRRRPWLWAAGVLGLGAIVMGGISTARRLERERSEAACAEESRAIAWIWGPERRRALQDAWSPHGPRADESLERMGAWLDDWTGQWAQARRSMCMRATVEHDLDPQLDARATACFEEQRERLAAMLEVYAQAEPSMLAGAVESAVGLSQLEPCSDERVLAQRSVPPASASPEALVAVRRRLARAAALADAGRYAEGLEEARAAVDDAGTLRWPALRAEARMIAAGVQSELGQYAQVHDELTTAFVTALQAGDDALAARVAIQLLRVLGYHLARTEEGLAWGTVAGALLRRLGREEGLDGAALANNTGLAHQSRGDLDEAMRWHQRALELRRRSLGDDHPETAHSYGNLGNLAVARERYDAARDWHARALAVRTAALGPNHPDTARSHNNLGRVYLAEGQTDHALRHFRRALEIFEPIGGAQHRLTARILHNIGAALLAEGAIEDAQRHYERALEIQRPLLGDEHPETARSAHDLGVLLARHGSPQRALEQLRAAASARRRLLGDDHPDTQSTTAAIAALCRAVPLLACDAP